ncbi:MAG: HAMP domain-containing histidine kinase [Oscillospiraceae bacterium]|nr:HAMP domain-containing histidine kinase [Oscillospiraceae bacterium]
MPESFDLSNPLILEQFKLQLNNLMASAQLLTPLVQGSGNTRHEQYLAILNQSLYRMLHLMQNVEYLSMPEEELRLEKAAFDPCALCRDLHEQAAPIAGQIGTQFQFAAESVCPAIIGDATLLQRMLLNLISNGLHATEHMEHAEIGLRVRSSADRIYFIVWDNGPGFMPEMESAMKADSFLPHQQGAQLGLYVARRIATLHGGTLVFDRSGDGGSRVTVSLPIVPPESSDILYTPSVTLGRTGGFSPIVVELSGVLPHTFFSPGNLE